MDGEESLHMDEEESLHMDEEESLHMDEEEEPPHEDEEEEEEEEEPHGHNADNEDFDKGPEDEGIADDEGGGGCDACDTHYLYSGYRPLEEDEDYQSYESDSLLSEGKTEGMLLPLNPGVKVRVVHFP